MGKLRLMPVRLNLLAKKVNTSPSDCPCGAMDNASDYVSEDCWFDSNQGYTETTQS